MGVTLYCPNPSFLRRKQRRVGSTSSICDTHLNRASCYARFGATDEAQLLLFCIAGNEYISHRSQPAHQLRTGNLKQVHRHKSVLVPKASLCTMYVLHGFDMHIVPWPIYPCHDDKLRPLHQAFWSPESTSWNDCIFWLDAHPADADSRTHSGNSSDIAWNFRLKCRMLMQCDFLYFCRLVLQGRLVQLHVGDRHKVFIIHVVWEPTKFYCLHSLFKTTSSQTPRKRN